MGKNTLQSVFQRWNTLKRGSKRAKLSKDNTYSLEYVPRNQGVVQEGMVKSGGKKGEYGKSKNIYFHLIISFLRLIKNEMVLGKERSEDR